MSKNAMRSLIRTKSPRSLDWQSGPYTVPRRRSASDCAFQMRPSQSGSILGSLLGIVVCGGDRRVHRLGDRDAAGLGRSVRRDRRRADRHGDRDGSVDRVDVAAAQIRAACDERRARHCRDRDAPHPRLRYRDQIAPITDADPAFDVPAAYEVLREIENRRRIAQGWQMVGRKIGFTNTTIWSRYGVYQPMWAHIWTHSTHFAKDGHATLELKPFVQPRIEPEVVFRLRSAIPPTNEPLEILRCVEWIAPGFEIVQSHFPDWKFTAPDCTAAFGLHGALSSARRFRSPAATAKRSPRRCRRSS